MRGIKKWIYSLIVCCCIGVAFSFVQPEKTEVKASETSAQGITVEANAEDFGVSADPNTSGTRDQYIWNADKEGALYSFTPHFIASNQNVYWRTEHDWVVFSFDTKGKSLYGENVLWTNNAGYIYYGNSHEDTNLKVSTNGNGAVSGGYEIETRGDVGYMAYVMNVKQNSYYASLPEKVVFKKGFAIVLTDGTAFVLNEDYTVYKVNGHYMPAKNLAGLKALSGVEVEQVKVKKAEYSNNELTLAFDKNLNINYGNQAVVSTAITLNNTTVSTYSGYIRTDAGNQNKIVYSNVSLSLTNEDELTVQNGFYTFFGANSAGTMYVVEVVEEYKTWSSGGMLTGAKPRAVMLELAEADGNLVKTTVLTGCTRANWAHVSDWMGLSLMLNDNHGIHSSSFAVYAGYIAINDEVITEKTVLPNSYKTSSTNELHLYMSPLKELLVPTVEYPYPKLTIKKGFTVAIENNAKYYATVIEEDYDLYYVDGFFLPIENLEELCYKVEEYSITNLTMLTDKSVRVNTDGAFSTDKASVDGEEFYFAGGTAYFDWKNVLFDGETVSQGSLLVSQVEPGNSLNINFANLYKEMSKLDKYHTLTFKKGFTLVYGYRNAEKFYGVRLKENYTVYYYNGQFTHEVPKLITGFSIQNETEKSVLGDELSLKVCYRYEDESVSPLPLADFTISEFDKNKLGKQTVTVTANGITDSFEIEVIENYLVSYKAMINPVEYEIGESIGDVYVLGFYYNGVPVRYNISDGVIVTGFESATAGKKVVTITYGEYQEQIEVKIKEANNAPTVEPETSDVSVDDGKKGCNGSVRTSYAVVGLSVFACVVCLFRKSRKEQK